MPCTYFDPPGTFCNDERDALNQKLHRYKTELDLATKLLCNLCTNLEQIRNLSPKTETLIEDVPGLENWWKEHNKMDLLRKKAEGKAKLEKNIAALNDKVKKIKELGGVPGRDLTARLLKAEKNLAELLKEK